MTDPDLGALTLGSDLTALGLNLSTPDPLYATFSSPYTPLPPTPPGSPPHPTLIEPHYTIPICYYMQPPALKTGHLSKFQLETLFHIFYSLPRDVLQAYAAQELYDRLWRYHATLKQWFLRTPSTGTDSVPGFLYFDTGCWERRRFEGGGVEGGLLGEESVRVKFGG